MPNRLLIIDDEVEFGHFVERVGQSAGYDVRTTQHANDFKATFTEWKPTAIVLDLVMPEIDGIELLRWLIEHRCTVPILILSGFDVRILDAAKRVGRERGLEIAAALSKPVRAPELKQRLEAMRRAEPQPLGAEDVEKALESNQLFVFYQPKVRLSDGTACGMEALLRWLHPERGVIPAGEMLDVIEASPMAETITEFVLRSGLQQQKKWAEEGAHLSLAVNMSASSLHDEHLPDRMTALCTLQDANPAKVVIEITETAAVSRELEALDILARLRLKGFEIAIDDFGAGYASLARLQHIPANEIKIDRSFVSEAPTSTSALAIVKSVIGLAQSLNMRCVAEGIETARHYRMLAELGCDVGQGYAIGKPLAGEKVIPWQQSWQPPWKNHARSPFNTTSSGAQHSRA